ncbi:hypothetical protein ZWY2020_048723 [Hordeum vulgare]|nr:hypothetical protein ZWY2020_048723 [Hordeum vulgare]
MADLEGFEFFTIILEKSSSRQGNTYCYCAASAFPLQGKKPMQSQEVAAASGLRRLWDVEVVFDTDGHMYLDRGWKQFVRAYDLRHMYFLVFRYDDNAMFTVKVFNTSMCRRRYEDEDDASNGRRSRDFGYNKSNSDFGYSKSSSSDSSYSKSSSSDYSYSKSSRSDSGYNKSSSEDEEERSGEEDKQSRDDEVVVDDGLAMVVADDGLAMVLVPDDDLAMVVVPDNDLAVVVVRDDGLAMVIPQLCDRTMPIVVEEYIPQPGMGLRHSKRIRMMKEKGKNQE